MGVLKVTLDVLNQINGALILVAGVGINQVYHKFKKWRKKDVSTLDEKVNKLEKTVDSLVDGSLALSHDKLYKNCTDYINRGSITVGERDNLEYIFSSYKKLGGNGTGEHLYLEAKNLPTKGEQ